MKATDTFKKTIEAYLTERAKSDVLFAVSYAKPTKNIDECINYILGAVQKSGCNGFEDAEIFGMAVHYYDEDKLEIGQLPTNCSVVVNHAVVLTEEDKAQIHEEAKKKAVEDAYRTMTAKATKKATPAPKDTVVLQTSLF